MKCRYERLRMNEQSGMTFLEVMLSIFVLLIISVAATNLIRHGIDMQFALSQRSKVRHRLSIAIDKLNSDIEHSFWLDRNRTSNDMLERSYKNHFSIKTRSGQTTLKLTSMNHQPIFQNANESDQSYIIYKVEEDRDTGVRKLLRGESKYIPRDFADKIPAEVLVTNIKSLTVKAWDGQAFKDSWNSDRSDWRGMVPHMVEVIIEAYDEDPFEGERFEHSEDKPSSKLRTVIYVPRTQGSKQKKDPSSNPKYY